MFHFCNCLLCIVKEKYSFLYTACFDKCCCGVFALEWMTFFTNYSEKYTITVFEKMLF